MADWNPSLYLQYGEERTRPAAELLARVQLDDVASIVDLGCGPGNSTALLRQRWPDADITGVDNSPAMLEEARAALPGCRFVEADIRQYKPQEPLSLIYANASLQWIPNHYDLLPHLVSLHIWRTTYFHKMGSHQAIIDWVSATGLRPWLQDLNESEQKNYLKRYHQLLEAQYPLQENGQILLAFPRLFIVAKRVP